MPARRWACLTVSALATAMLAQGQTPERRVFTPADFERFAPLTALDMVREIPGFTLKRGASARGLGQASGNVLINGKRSSGKSNDTIDALSRVPAGRVVRIELSDAATLSIPGVSGQVANIITDGEGLSGVWEWQPRFRERLAPRYDRGSVSLTGEQDDLSWTVGLESDGNRFANKGPEFITDADDILLERRDEDLEGRIEALEGTFGLNWDPLGAREANLSLAYGTRTQTRRERGHRQPQTGPDTIRVFEGREEEWDSEISADLSFGGFGGQVKLIGLHRHEDSRDSDRVNAHDPADGQFLERARFDQDSIENEAVVRLEFDWRTPQGRDWQLASEHAYNRLDAGSVAFVPQAGGGFAAGARAVPTRVEETRGEISLTHGRKLSAQWRLQASLAGEYSEISSRVGENADARNFLRPKGYLQASWEPDDTMSLNLRVEREVGQLDFLDFVGSQDIDEGLDDAGNTSLVPDQAWRMEAELDRRFGKSGAASLLVYREDIEDIIDRVPLGAGREGPGNIDRAYRFGAELDLTVNLDGAGLDGFQWALDLEWQQSRLDDPLTGESRPISDDTISFYFTELRWDVPGTPYAFLIASRRDLEAKTYRLDEIRQFREDRPSFWVEARHKSLFGIDAHVRLGNLLDTRDTLTRVIYAPDRTGDIIRRQRYARDFGPILSFGFSGSF
ncbi:MAG: hypothetical protein GVY06_11615 [Alphaproteobacteria bacterium]|jgi:hypothetical protein|nr:hypothetical protein [Alphaproteobacteria bacterium]